MSDCYNAIRAVKHKKQADACDAGKCDQEDSIRRVQVYMVCAS